MRITGRGLFVDAFAGGGGASQGIYEATGHHVDVAINHDESAIVLHQANHPKTHHYLQSVYDVNPLKLVTDDKGNFSNFINVLWASPDCRHHSNASGKAINRSEEIRGLAWSVIPYAALPEEVRPRIIFLENVVEFMSWGPLDENGKPIKEKAGVNFHSFIKALNSLGYKVEWKVLVAADYGVATTRERFFLVARCDGKPICWPQKTHAPLDSISVKNGLKKPYKAAGEIIDWKLACTPIEGRKKPLATNTLNRIANGIKKFILNDEPFYVPGSNRSQAAFIITYYTETRENEVRGLHLNKPLATITAKGNRFGLVTVDLVETNIKDTYSTLPDSYGLKEIDGKIYAVMNPKLRILEPRELFNAHGFPKDYVINGNLTLKQLASKGIDEHVFVKEKIEEIKARRSSKNKSISEHENFMQLDLFSAGLFESDEFSDIKVFHSYSKKEQIARVGNSVPPKMAQVLVEANLPEYCSKVEREMPFLGGVM